MDARTGKVIQAVNADTRVHPASLTKMMTLYIVFDEIRRGRLSLDQKVTVSANAAAEPPSRLGLRAGQKIELRYLIRAAAIKSANDAATALGEAVAGSEEAFAARMNAVCPRHGHDEHHLQERERPDPRRGTCRPRATWRCSAGGSSTTSRSTTTSSAGPRPRPASPRCSNTNRRLLEAYPGADGIKTGYTRAAGFNLVSSAQRGDRRVIVALLGGKSTASRNAEVARLMDLGFAKMPARARLAPPAPLRAVLVAVAAAPAPAAARLAPPPSSRRRARRRRCVAGARPMPRALDGRRDRAQQRDHRRGDRRGERRADRRAGDAQRPGVAARPRRPADAAARAPPRPREPIGVVGLRLDLRRRSGRAAGRAGPSRADRGGRARAPAPPAATTGACSSAPTAPRATPSGSC